MANTKATGVSPDYARLSIGIQNHTDLQKDFDQALAKA